MQRLSDYGRRLPISSMIGIVQPLHRKMQRQNVVARELATPTKNETLTTWSNGNHQERPKGTAMHSVTMTHYSAQVAAAALSNQQKIWQLLKNHAQLYRSDVERRASREHFCLKNIPQQLFIYLTSFSFMFHHDCYHDGESSPSNEFALSCPPPYSPRLTLTYLVRTSHCRVRSFVRRYYLNSLIQKRTGTRNQINKSNLILPREQRRNKLKQLKAVAVTGLFRVMF